MQLTSPSQATMQLRFSPWQSLSHCCAAKFHFNKKQRRSIDIHRLYQDIPGSLPENLLPRRRQILRPNFEFSSFFNFELKELKKKDEIKFKISEVQISDGFSQES